MNKTIKFFPEEIKVIFEDPKSIEFNNKTFHLSGDFAIEKSEFGKLIVELGGQVRGVYKGTEQLNFSKTDYFVSADAGAKGKPYGDKTIKVQKYNDRKAKGTHHIPIIKESTCKNLIDEYVMRRAPKNM